MVKVKNLIILLLNQPMDAEVIAKKKGKHIKDVELSVRTGYYCDRDRELGCLFG